MDDDEVEVAVVVEVAAGQAAAHVAGPEVGTRAGAHVGEPAAAAVVPEDRRVLVGVDLGGLAADVSVGGDEVETAVEVEVGERGAPAGQVAGLGGEARLVGLVMVEQARAGDVRGDARGSRARRRSG